MLRIRTLPILALVLAAPVARALDGVLPYEKIAKDYAARVGVDAAHLDAIQLDDVLAKRYVHATLGAFELEWPGYQVEKHAGELKACADALLRAQETWLDWVQTSGVDQKPVREDLKTVQKAVKGWVEGALSKAKPGDDLFATMVAPQNVRDAVKRLADALQKGQLLGITRESPRALPVVFQPTRQDFSEFVYFAGMLLPDSRGLFWLDNVPDWTQCYVEDRTVVTLQYGVNGRQPTDYTSGTWMNERDAKVMEQQVAQLAMNALFLDQYKDRVPGAFIGGLSMNVVIDGWGLVNTRVDGDTRGRFVGKREVFIPGGASEGGTLPKQSAETRWREKYGSDRFVPVLRAAQKEGADVAKDVKNKAASFALHDDAGSARFPVSAPFFGAAASTTKAPPSAFQGDFAEFLRAYKSAFMYWLQTKSQAGEKASREKFAQLLKKLSDPAASADFEAVFKEIYDGAPLSSPAADKDCLEGRFLIWLSKQK